MDHYDTALDRWLVLELHEGPVTPKYMNCLMLSNFSALEGFFEEVAVLDHRLRRCHGGGLGTAVLGVCVNQGIRDAFCRLLINGIDAYGG